MTARLGSVALALLCALAFAKSVVADETRLMPLVEAGRYLEAAELARGLGDPQCLALGAGALSVYGAYVAQSDKRREAFEEALELAKAARTAAKSSGAADPVLAEVRFQEGQALGRLAETLPPDEREPYAEPVREAFEAALKHDSSRWEPHAGLANWHAKVMLSADEQAGLFGALGANLIYGASYEEAEAHRASAARVDKRPAEEKVFRLESAEILLLLDADDNREAAKRELDASLAIEAPNHLGEKVHERAADCLADITACAQRLQREVLQ